MPEQAPEGNQRRKVPVPMLPLEIIRIETAMLLGQVSDKTIRRWAASDGIGRQADKSSPLQISAPALCMRVDGDIRAIDLLRAGKRADPAVMHYIQRAQDLLAIVGAREPHKS